MSNTKNTDNNKVSKSKTIIRYDFTFLDIEFQFDNIQTGIIIVVNNTK